MADAYWRYGDGRQQPAALPPHVVKRPRTDSDMPSGPDMSGYYGRDEDRAGLRVIRDTDTMNATYDRYLRNVQMPSYASESGRSMSSGLGGHHHVDDPRALGIVRPNPAAAAAAAKNRSLGVGGRPEIPLPPDASSTLFVEGLPANCTRREVSRYKEVRLVTKESRHSGGDPLVLCFVDFQSPAHAATAMDAIQEGFWLLIYCATEVGVMTVDHSVLHNWDSFNFRGMEFDGNLGNQDLEIFQASALYPIGNANSFSYLMLKRAYSIPTLVGNINIELNLAGYNFDEHDRDSTHLRLQFARFPGARSRGGHRGPSEEAEQRGEFISLMIGMELLHQLPLPFCSCTRSIKIKIASNEA
ncbi:hypothetical protein SASPL_119120 [Salvia splendens]|uniref:RRM domain-containing protein n=1 Tax=Salvia splendens TaxID=180675 RepID=A0A8X8Y0Y9_SALSN|nr:hypothetical protein SASPL_119120 [Salvia splendens]